MEDEKGKLLRIPNWNDLSGSVVYSLNEFLSSKGIMVKGMGLHCDDELDCQRLQLELCGKPLANIGGSFELNWLLPKRENYFMINGSRERPFVSPYRAELTQPEKEKSEKDKKGNKKNKWKLSLNSAPDIDRGEVFSKWWLNARYLWKEFKESDISLERLIRLESRLNAVWTSGRKRGSLMLRTSADNPLLEIEQARGVTFGKAAVDGRLRLPHDSHKYKICPFHTPESQNIGLDLFLAAGAEVTSDGIIQNSSSEKYLFSVAVGMVPYPFHTDGPRLLMGGKNMKQAETGIMGAEPSIVPGYLEGSDALKDLIPALKGRLDNDGRLRPYIGLNALTVVMPFEGFTYEDGLVVSKSLAERLSISDGNYSVTKAWKSLFVTGDDCAAPLNELKDKIKKTITLKDYSRYVYGEDLPLPGYGFFEKGEEGLTPYTFAAEIYAHHSPGTITRDNIEITLERARPLSSKGIARAEIKLSVKWSFLVDRPLGLGDKLTGRSGNKGVVTKILDDCDMPQVTMGGKTLPAELLISPSSIMGRKNLGQLWEMAHSALIKNGADVPTDREMSEENRENLRELLMNIGADERGTFPVSVKTEDETKDVRAFAGWQYFCRLNHHAWKKLQGRGAWGPMQKTVGQPAVCSARTGQRLGEMENWSLLSHGAEKRFFKMREFQTGDIGETKKLMRKIFNSLNLDFDVSDESFALKKLEPPATDIISMQELFRINFDEARDESYTVTFWNKREKPEDVDGAPKSRKLSIKDKLLELEQEIKNNSNEKFKLKPEILAMLDENGNIHVEAELLALYPNLKARLREFFRSTDPKYRAEALEKYHKELKSLLSGKLGIPRRHLLGRRYNHTGRAVIVPCPELKAHEVYLPFAMLVELLDGYGEKYQDKKFFTKDIRDVRASVNDPQKISWNEKEAAQCDGKLQTKEHELWAFLVRQPSLHRHSIQSFRVRCWNEPVIGLPPLATPGFNADFDGDTMAVFLSDKEILRHVKKIKKPETLMAELFTVAGASESADNSHSVRNDRLHNELFETDAESHTFEPMENFCLPNNPGLVGDGSQAFATGLDLALGWWNMGEDKKKEWYRQDDSADRPERPKKPEKLSDYMPRLLKILGQKSLEERANELFKLQRDICRAMTGTATLTPLEFDALFQHLGGDYHKDRKKYPKINMRIADEKERSKKHSQKCTAKNKEVEERIKGFLEEHSDFGLAIILASGARGKESDVRQMTWAIGEIDIFDDNKATKQDIEGCFWKGLSVDEMFLYSYPSRKGMAQKKLAVADAGYLSRQLAEGLYEIRVTADDCETAEGLEISYNPDSGQLTAAVDYEAELFPTSGKLESDLSRIAWGRTLVGAPDICLNSADIKAVIACWQNDDSSGLRDELKTHLAKYGDCLYLRSPLFCNEKKSGGVCAKCCGADVASKPYDRPGPVKIGAFVGLTAAQAIGERGTQLAMKRFHDVSGGKDAEKKADEETKIAKLRKLFIYRKKMNLKARFKYLLENILTEKDEDQDEDQNEEIKADKELPQSFVHYELALTQEENFKTIASDSDARYLSVLAYENIMDLLRIDDDKKDLTDDLNSLKSRVMWK